MTSFSNSADVRNTHGSRDKNDDVINQLLLSRGIPGVSFNFIPYMEVEIPRGGGSTPPKKLLGV